MKRIIVIQARMTSSRLPGKVLRELGGRPMLAQQIRRLKACASVDDIVLATTTNADDDPVVALARDEQVRWFRGSEHDVLARVVGAVTEANADVLVRVTADCPLIDPGTVDRTIDTLVANAAACDYASNVQKRTFPRGLDSEALFRDTLARMDRMGQSQSAREHVTVFLRSERPELFATLDVVDEDDNSDLRWTVDTAADLEMIRAIYAGLGLDQRVVTYREILEYIRSQPQIAAMNAHVETWNPK